MKKGKAEFQNNVSIKNRRAYYEYEILDTYTAGMVLKGSEIKSIRLGKASLPEGYCYIEKGELWIKNMHIAEYEQGGYANHDSRRNRKLLLKKGEIEKLKKKTEEKGLTIIPLKLFISSRGFAKLEVGLAKGKKLFDKRQDIKSKDTKKELQDIGR